MRLFLLAIFAIGAMLVQARTVLAQTGYSISLEVSDAVPGISPLDVTKTASGSWSTPAGDTISFITFNYSSDGGMTYVAVLVPAANITGAGGVKGTYFVDVPLPNGTYTSYTSMRSKNGVVTKSNTVDFTVP